MYIQFYNKLEGFSFGDSWTNKLATMIIPNPHFLNLKGTKVGRTGEEFKTCPPTQATWNLTQPI